MQDPVPDILNQKPYPMEDVKNSEHAAECQNVEVAFSVVSEIKNGSEYISKGAMHSSFSKQSCKY